MKRKIFSVLFALALVLSFSLVTAVPAAAQTDRLVPSEYATIQLAIDAASEGDTIIVAAGTYTEDVDVNVAGITIQGESLDAIVDGGFALTVDDITIDGFTIQNGRPGPLASYHPAAISVEGESDGHTISNNTIIGNGSVPSNGILLCHSNDGVLIDGNVVYNWRRGITLRVYGSNVTISNNEVYDNLIEGIGLGDSTNCVVTENDIHGNNTLVDTAGGGGISVYKGSGHVINYNNIYDNFHSGLSNMITTNLNATLNWWGDASGPGPVGLGNSVICDGGTIASYSPWLGQSKDTAHPWIFCVDDVGTEPTAGYIQTAINGATAGDTISVADGTYDTETFPIDVDVANLTIESVSGAASTTINSGSDGMVIAISAAGVTIGGTGKGFVITGTGAVADGLIYIGASATITENQFVGDYYLMVLAPGVSGVTVEDNTFLASSTPGNDVLGIYVNNNVTGSTFDGNFFPLTAHVDSGIYLANGTTADQTITISNNTFEGMGKRNSYGCAAIELDGVGGITIESNTIRNSNDGIWFEGTTALTGDVTIRYNTITGNAWGIEVKDGVGTVGTITVNYNNLGIDSTTSDFGLENAETDLTVDARYNWWGDVAGPHHAGNPYHDYADAGEGVIVSYYVDYSPWLIHTELVSGWNIYSTPIALDSSCDTIAKALDIWTADYSENFDIALYFNSSASPPAWSSDITTLTPLQAYYLKMSAAATMDVWFSSSYNAPPSRIMYQGWNLVGPAELYHMPANGALLDAFWGTGEANLWGYSKVISPPLHQTYWAYLHGQLGNAPYVIPTNGYWVYMVNQGTLGGFTSTPITEVPPLP